MPGKKNIGDIKIIQGVFSEHRDLLKDITDIITTPIIELTERIKEVLESGEKIILFGNGGSASDALHFSAELVGSMSEYKRTIPAISLVSDPSVLTSLSNDYGFEDVFSKQISALGNKGDMAIAISTSGNSQNCVNAINIARDKGLVTSALLGGEGGELVSLVEYPLVVPSSNTQRIQEMHILIIHIICQIIKGWAEEVDFRP